jgi:hypothetical protein
MRIHGIVAASQFANVLIMILLCVLPYCLGEQRGRALYTRSSLSATAVLRSYAAVLWFVRYECIGHVADRGAMACASRVVTRQRSRPRRANHAAHATMDPLAVLGGARSIATTASVTACAGDRMLDRMAPQSTRHGRSELKPLTIAAVGRAIGDEWSARHHCATRRENAACADARPLRRAACLLTPTCSREW